MRTVVFAVLLLAACTIDKRGDLATDSTVELDVGDQTGGDSVLVRISAPRTASKGDVVPLTIVVQNNRKRTIELHLTGREIIFDIVIARANKSVLWQRLDPNAPHQQIVQLKTLAPGESFSLTENWKANERGAFVVGAELPTDANPLVAAPVGITIR